MTARVYDETVKRLTKAGLGHPAGRLYHACFGTADGVSVFDVWTSQSAFEKFGQVLMPILRELGADAGQPMVSEVHNVVVPSAARRPVAKKRTAARVVAKRGTSRGRSRRKR